jgi:hypothetical protein
VPASYAEVFSYPAFGGTNVQQLSLVGSARIHQSEHVAWLTPDQNDQLGALWHSGIIPLPNVVPFKSCTHRLSSWQHQSGSRSTPSSSQASASRYGEATAVKARMASPL